MLKMRINRVYTQKLEDFSMKELIGIIGTGFLMAGFAPYVYALW